MSVDFARAGRTKKAYDIARVLFREGITVERLKTYDVDEWVAIARYAGFAKTELSDETKRLTIEKLAMLYDPEAA